MPFYHVRAHNGPNAFQFNMSREVVDALVTAHLRSQTPFMFQGRRYDLSESSTFVEVVETQESVGSFPGEDPMATWRRAWDAGREVSGELTYLTEATVTSGDSDAPAPGGEGRRRIFISHATEDALIAGALARLLRLGCNLDEGAIFLTSSAEYSVPSGEDWAAYIEAELRSTALVVALISPAFLRSEFCLCEVGAQWMLRQPWHPMLLSPATAADANRLPQRPQATPIDRPSSLDELRDRIETLLGAVTSTTGWNTNRDAFLQAVAEVASAAAEGGETPAADAETLPAGASEAVARLTWLSGVVRRVSAELEVARRRIEQSAREGHLWNSHAESLRTDHWQADEVSLSHEDEVAFAHEAVALAYAEIARLNTAASSGDYSEPEVTPAHAVGQAISTIRAAQEQLAAAQCAVQERLEAARV